MLGELADALTTYYAIGAGYSEGNPLVATMIGTLGLTWALALKVGVVSLLGFRMPRRMLQVFAALGFLIAAWNLTAVLY